MQNWPVFERDFKEDSSENGLTIYSYLSYNIYFELTCTYNYNYEVHFALNNYPFELELLRSLAVYPLKERAKLVIVKPDFSIFYENVLRVQDRKHITFF